ISILFLEAFTASPKELVRWELERSSYRARVGRYPLFVDVVARDHISDPVPTEQFPNSPLWVHEDTRRPATPDRRWRDRRSHPLTQERQGSHGLSGARRGAQAVREGLSRHEAAQLSETCPVPGRAQGTRQPPGACHQQEHAFRAKGAGSG